jgi:hypothetical protein
VLSVIKGALRAAHGQAKVMGTAYAPPTA